MNKNPFNQLSNIDKKVLHHIGYSINDYYKDINVSCKLINDMYITNIKCIYKLSFFQKRKLIVHLELNRPGLIIGKEGKLIQKIVKDLSDWFEINISLKIYESKLEGYLFAFTCCEYE